VTAGRGIIAHGMGVTGVVHLNTASFRVRAARLVRSRAGLLDGSIACVTHCLLVETERHGLALVDVGLGTTEADDPRRVPAPVRFELRPAFRRQESALAQVRALGHDPRDVRHVVFTHLDLDHASGLADFPWATAHAAAAELRRATAATGGIRRMRFDPRPLRAHGRWQLHEPGDATLAGLTGVRPLAALDDDLALVPLPGHSRAHCGVAVRREGGWLLHAGDAYLHREEVDRGAAPGLHQLLVETDRTARRATVERLRELRRDRAAGVELFCSHDPAELERLRPRPG
jgi:glyoxylase-like metal-dependent hydrolase (beta-lactamase superfamily II)